MNARVEVYRNGVLVTTVVAENAEFARYVAAEIRDGTGFHALAIYGRGTHDV